MHVRHQEGEWSASLDDFAQFAYSHRCKYCDRGFPCRHGLSVHVGAHCGLARRETFEEEFNVECVLDARGPPEHRFYSVCWEGVWEEGKVGWEPWTILRNSSTAIDEFFEHSDWSVGDSIEVVGEARCVWCNRFYKSSASLKAHHTRGCDCKPGTRVGSKAEKAIIRSKKVKAQEALEPVQLDGTPLNNVFNFKYLGFWYQADGDRRHALRVQIAKAGDRFSRLWHIWKGDTLGLEHKVRLFESAVVSLLVYGCEVWMMTEDVQATLKGWCARCMSKITGCSIRDECVHPTYPLVDKVRVRRLKYLGHVLRSHEEFLPRRVILAKLTELRCSGGSMPTGSLMMDAPAYDGLDELIELAHDRSQWRVAANTLCYVPGARGEDADL